MDLASARHAASTTDNARPAQSIQTPAEVLRLLAQVRDQDTAVELLGCGGQSISCKLWAVDGSAGRLSFGVDETHTSLQPLLQDSHVQAVTQLDGIRLDFDLNGLVLVRAVHSCSLQAAIPQRLNRHQRRESFRVRVAQRGSPAVRIAHPQRPGEHVNLRVLDISIGGCSLLLPQNLPRLESGTHLKGSRVDLGAGVRFTADLLVRSLRPTTANPDCRVGCEWQSVDSSAQRTLQRFIDDAQRRWRSPTSG